MCIYTHNTLNIYAYNIYTYNIYTIHIHIYVPVILTIMNSYSHLEVEFILEGGAEVTYPLSGNAWGSSRRWLKDTLNVS